MTHHTLSSFRDAKLGPSHQDCTFCQISSKSIPAYIVYEDARTLAFLDILPIRKGHTLVIPKQHVLNLAEVDDQTAEDVARSMVRVARGLGRALGDDRLQAITNQGYAQIVPHVHFHIVPAPPLPSSSSSTAASGGKSEKRKPNPLTVFGHGREELDEGEAEGLAERIRAAIRQCEEERVQKTHWNEVGKTKL